MVAAAASGAAAASTALGVWVAGIVGVLSAWLAGGLGLAGIGIGNLSLLCAGGGLRREVLEARLDPGLDAGHDAAHADAGEVLDVAAVRERPGRLAGGHDLLD